MIASLCLPLAFLAPATGPAPQFGQESVEPSSPLGLSYNYLLEPPGQVISLKEDLANNSPAGFATLETRVGTGIP